MKRIFIYAMAAAALMMTVSCGNRGKKADEAKAGETVGMTDIVPAAAAAPVDTVALKKQNWEKVVPGYQVPDFRLKNLDGEYMTLESFKGKYVLLDFWGTWCRWCIKGIPEMKEYYAKYRDRIEFVGIDCRDKEETWRNAVERHRLPWLHVRDEDHPDVSLLYAISVYPTTVVVDPEGRIAKIVQGESPVLYEYLDELFQTED